MPIISLTTDFSTRDGNVGVMKGVILGIAPDAKIVDISHAVEPQNIQAAAHILKRQVFYFPAGTVHVVVVDPGVGTQRRPIAAQVGPQRFVGPDNGVFSPLYERAEKENWEVKIVHLNNPEFWLDTISSIFHGRDIFSPVGAHWAAGTELESLGEVIDDPVRFETPIPERTENGVMGEVVYIDHFGNISTNIHKSDMMGLDEDLAKVKVRVSGFEIKGMVNTFGERPAGEIVALYSSTDYLIVSEVNGSAVKRLKTKLGDKFEVDINK